MVEARIDFPDEADVPEDLLAPALRIARELADDIAQALDDGRRGERLREGLVVAIAGPPNAGKSTLLNRIARREAAIVSPYAGTTRDVIEMHLDLDGQPVTLLDTAGIRPTDDPVEMEGVRRARERASAADLVLWVVDAAAGPMAEPDTWDAAVWIVENKADLLGGRNESGDVRNEQIAISSQGAVNPISTKLGKGSLTKSPIPRNEPIFNNAEHRFKISAANGGGVEPLIAAIAAHAAQVLGSGEPALVTRERHRHALESALGALRRATAEPAASREDLIAEELRLAAAALGRLTGRIDVEDVLDVIFRDFCIGK
jgi:tRNA modification GTPase